MVDEMEIVGFLREIEPLSDGVYEHARTVLRAAMIPSGESELAPVEPVRRRRRRKVAVGSTVVVVGVAAAVAAALVITTPSLNPGLAPHRPGTSTRAVTVNAPLMRLSAFITANDPQPSGDATLVLRNQAYPTQPAISGADLYTDSGEYFYSPSESGLPAAIAANDNIGDGMFAREVAAATYAVNGNLATARQRMATAPFASGTFPSVQSDPSAAQAKAEQLQRLGIKVAVPPPTPAVSNAARTDNYIWMDSLDALSAGAGNPQVRAGVLRILSTLPEVTVTNAVFDGQPALTLTAAAPALPADYQEALTINAQTGVPMGFTGGTPGQTPGVTVTYQISRVTVSDIAAGKF
jgi:hypothetical protein